MVLNTIDMNMQSLADKRLTACLLLIILELFFDGKFFHDNHVTRKRLSYKLIYPIECFHLIY